MANYRLSNSADEDFENIFIYGVRRFGLRQAEQYAEGLEARFEQIAELPRLYPAADHIKPGYRLSVYASHTIYYRADEQEVLIVRILRNQEPSIALIEDPEG